MIEKEQWREAIADCTEGLRLNPKDIGLLETRGNCYGKESDYDHAIADFTEWIGLKRSRRAYDFRARAYDKEGKYPEAIADYKQGAQESGPVTRSIKGLAWLLASCPDPSFRDPKQAVTEATEDCERTAWKSWNCLDTLAAAFASAGDFDAAIRYEQQALAGHDPSPTWRTEMEQRLALYQKRQPYREAKPRLTGG